MRFHAHCGALCTVAAAALTLGGTASGSVTAGDAAPSTATHAPISREAAAPVGSWTVLQYSMSDTDLEPYMMADVNEMGEVGSNENLNIVAMIDRSEDYGEEPVLDIGDWVGAVVAHIQPGHAEVLADLGPTDMGDPETLATFITEGIAAFPAEHYALIISDHGAAWPGVGPDDSGGFRAGSRRPPAGPRNRTRQRRGRRTRPPRHGCLPDGGVRGRAVRSRPTPGGSSPAPSSSREADGITGRSDCSPTTPTPPSMISGSKSSTASSSTMPPTPRWRSSISPRCRRSTRRWRPSQLG